jgi:hypothetical protein
MTATWEQLSGFERAEMILNNIGGLSNEEIQAVYDEWSEMEFEPTPTGIIHSEVELQRIAVEHLLKKQGKWEHEVNRRREELEPYKDYIK